MENIWTRSRYGGARPTPRTFGGEDRRWGSGLTKTGQAVFWPFVSSVPQDLFGTEKPYVRPLVETGFKAAWLGDVPITDRKIRHTFPGLLLKLSRFLY